MHLLPFLKLYGAGILVCFGLDLLWLGVVAKGFYQRYIGHLMRPDVQWIPGIAFYLIYVAVLVIIVVMPSLEKRSLGRAVTFGALFGLAAYSAYNLTCLALLKDYPTIAGLVDIVWGTAMTTVVSASAYAVGAASSD